MYKKKVPSIKTFYLKSKVVLKNERAVVMAVGIELAGCHLTTRHIWHASCDVMVVSASRRQQDRTGQVNWVLFSLKMQFDYGH